MLLGSGYPYSGPGHMEKHLLSILVLMVMNYPTSIGIGMPIVAVLYFRQKLTGLNCIAWALVAGAAAGVIFPWVVDPADHVPVLSVSVVFSAIFAVIGGLTALVFCLIAGLGIRPSPREA
ncbi:hypothetical protein GCM10010836_12870 [Aminobacter aminovorans]